MDVTVAWLGARYHGSYASAVAVIAAAWRAGGTASPSPTTTP